MNKKIRVLIAKPDLDDHDRGAPIVSQVLRDHGMEVIYTGLRQTPTQIAKAAIQEDVDVIGISSLSGAHKTLFPKVVDELRKLGADDIPVIGSGVIPSEDINFLYERGIKKVFTSASSTNMLVQYIEQLIQPTFKSVPTPKKITHIGIAVKCIDDVLPFYTDSLGLEFEAIENVASEAVKIAFLKIGETRIELLEPLDPTSPIHHFIEQKGEGIHHIALEVEQIKERLKQLHQLGVALIDLEPRTGANNSQIAFIHPKAANGVLYELCQHNDHSEKKQSLE